MPYPRIYPIHDHALTIEFSTLISEEVHRKVMQMKRVIEKNSFDGLVELVPAYTSLTVYFRPPASQIEVHAILQEQASNLEESDEEEVHRKIEIPVCYDPSLAVDLEIVMQSTGLDHDSIVRLHTENEFKVYMIGFMPGFAYMGTLPSALEIGRKKTPSLNIPSGSVAIAGKQTGIYPSTSPGGWNVIGRTPVRMFDPEQPPYSYLQAGDRVRFKAISLPDYESYL